MGSSVCNIELLFAFCGVIELEYHRGRHEHVAVSVNEKGRCVALLYIFYDVALSKIQACYKP